MTNPYSLTFKIEPIAMEFTVNGRDAWALKELLKARCKGCTPIHNPGPRWSSYIHNLRKMGVHIETIHETHGDPFSGTHARYVLRSLITVLHSN